ncbi:MAG TPA: exodeoxyribonuclease VII large subunit [Acidimicrobiia bacterium]|nr:exodeoxyribonuclease VII large subunit [Acidimicrobiia bacterium]
MSADPETLTVAEALARIDGAIASRLPGPIWIRGEVTGFRRTAGGAGFFRLADPVEERQVIDVSARGLVMREVDVALGAAGIGGLRDGVEVRVKGTVGVDRARSVVRLSLLGVDPAFTAGRLAVDRQEVMRRLAADGSLAANGRLPLPLVPLDVGLVTSRGSAGHADFLDQLRISGYRFCVRTVHASMQGASAVGEIVRALGRLGAEPVDVVVLVRGGGSKLDLAAFDSEEVSRAVARTPVPVVAGIGHEIDRSVVDEVAAVSVKTPTAAAEWLVGSVADYAGRIDTARRAIREEARRACSGASQRLDHSAALLGGVRSTISRQHDRLVSLGAGLADESRRVVGRQAAELENIEQLFAAMGVEATLQRGFTLVTDVNGRVVRSADAVRAGDRLGLRFADGSVTAVVDQTDG